MGMEDYTIAVVIITEIRKLIHSEVFMKKTSLAFSSFYTYSKVALSLCFFLHITAFHQVFAGAAT